MMRFSQISVDLDYERQFLLKVDWVPVVFFLLIWLLSYVWVRFGRHYESGFFIVFIIILDRHSMVIVSILAPRNVVDEFTDLSHWLIVNWPQEFFRFDQVGRETLAWLEKALYKVNTFFVTNHEGDIVWLVQVADSFGLEIICIWVSVCIDSG